MSFFITLLNLYSEFRLLLENQPNLMILWKWIHIMDDFYQGKKIEPIQPWREYGENGEFFIEKRDNIYICREHQETTKQTTVRFLSIEYKSEDESIILEIPDEFYMEGNEIFSTSFLQWYFPHFHPNSAVSEKYTIIIMDHKLKTVTINQTNYIRLKQNDYCII